MKYIFYAIISSIIFAACSESGGDEPIPYTGKVNASVTLQSRSTDISNPAQNELINSWWVAFVNSQNKVVKIVNRPAYKTEAVETDTLNVEIDAGIYDIYAFANMSNSDPNSDRFGFREGSDKPNDIDNQTWSYVPGVGEWIPMTGKINVDLRQQASTQFKIEVVRLVAKMQFEVTNDTGNDITLQNISLQPAQVDKVNLFPDYMSLGHRPVLNDGANLSQLSKPYNEAIAHNGTFKDTFYLFESTAEGHPSEHYVVKMNILHSSGRYESISAQTYELQWINRNDYIILPLRIIDFSLAFDILFYPPIGGYPAILVEEKADEYYAKFGSSGKFVLNPKITDSSGYILAPEEYTISTPLEVNDPAGILSVKPAIDETTGEIIGELATGSKSGTATVDFEVTATYKGGTAPISYTFSRTLYIIRQ
ncbi:MAG: hypothetical protein NC453_12415 [Muribaculum sp.]|nr:hypothetical protein [Muribaculum sp.]